MPSKNSSQAPLIDISLPLSPLTVTYPGDPAVEIEKVKGASADDVALVHKLCMGTHSGTHIDAPAHIVRGGQALPQIDLSRLVGECCVLDCTECEVCIDAETLAGKEIAHEERVLLKTKNSKLISQAAFNRSYVYLTPDGAGFLAELGASLVGIDYLSIGQMGPSGVKTHRTLLARDVLILEGLDLSQVAPGSYELLCLPLRIDVPDGAPVRALLRPLRQAEVDLASQGGSEGDTTTKMIED